MEWTVSELKSRGKKVYLADLSEKPDLDSFEEVASLPSGIDRVVIGITKTESGDIIPILAEKSVKNVTNCCIQTH